MSKPIVILDAHWRQMDELFSPEARAALFDEFEVVWGQDGPIPGDILSEALPRAEILISSTPRVSASTLSSAPALKTIIEVSGAFPDTIDYTACFERNVEILGCAPGFRRSVAEMGLAMALAGARGLVSEHEAFRVGEENWLDDRTKTDFTLFGASVGFIGFGQIAQEIVRLMQPFAPAFSAYDPWLPSRIAMDFNVRLCSLEDVLAQCRCVFVTASPTSENYHLLNAERLALLQDHALLIVLSRAHLVDFGALEAQVSSGRITACIDVFPSEPVPAGARIRTEKQAILSPHRAAAVDKGRQLIGDMILHDLRAKTAGQDERLLSRANAKTIMALAGIGDAEGVAALAAARQSADPDRR
ncbi:MAG: NAD(P)-dependent oxidoreductase [Pseudomonadota bacterium]